MPEGRDEQHKNTQDV